MKGDRRRTPIPNKLVEQQASEGQGDVNITYLSPDELAEVIRKYGAPTRALPVWPNNPMEVTNMSGALLKSNDTETGKNITKGEFIKLVAAGGSISSIEKSTKMKVGSLYYIVKKWGLTGITAIKAKEMLSEGVEQSAKEEKLEQETQRTKLDTKPAVIGSTVGDLQGADAGTRAEDQKQDVVNAGNMQIAEKMSSRIISLKTEVATKDVKITALEQEIEHLKAPKDLTTDPATIAHWRSFFAGIEKPALDRLKEEHEKVVSLKNIASTLHKEEINRLRQEIEDLMADGIDVSSHKSQLLLRIPIAPAKNRIEQRVGLMKDMEVLAEEVDSREMDLRLSTTQLFEVIQRLVDMVQAQLQELIIGDDSIPRLLEQFFTYHNDLHLSKMAVAIEGE